MTIDTTKLYQATITTARGKIVLCLQPELAPNTVNNFVALARNHFYDGLKFHRVEASFVIQGGDPTGDGTAAPATSSTTSRCTTSTSTAPWRWPTPVPTPTARSSSSASARQCSSLQPQYNLFGKVETGLDVALKIQKSDVMTTVTVAEQR